MPDNVLTRRDFIKKTGQTALAIGGALTFDALLSSCATMSFKEEPPVIYPPLKGHKVQSPENGCLIGFHGAWEVKPSDWNPWKDEHPESIISLYKNMMGKAPKIMIRYSIYSEQLINYPGDFIVGTHNEGVIPFVYLAINSALREHGSLKSLVNNKEFNADIKRYAKRVEEEKIPYFISTMREMNLSSQTWPWGGQPNVAKKVWKNMWQIFEDNGANEYATWVWEIYCPEGIYHDYPERYYPGDKYVDWIVFLF